MRLIDRIDQVDVAVCVCWGHRDLVRSRGRRPITLSNICSIVKSSRYFPRLILLHEGGPAASDRCFEAGSRPLEVSDPEHPRCPPPKPPSPLRSGPPRAPTDPGSYGARRSPPRSPRTTRCSPRDEEGSERTQSHPWRQV